MAALMTPPFMNQNPAASTLRTSIFSALVFLFPALALTSTFGVGLVEALFLLAILLHARPLWAGRTELFGPARWIILALGFNLALAVASVLIFKSKPSFLDNPSRQFAAVGVIALLALVRPKEEMFWNGLVIGVIAAGGIAVFQVFYLGHDRAGGFHQIIMFGDIAMAMGLMSLAAIPHFRGTRLRALPYLAFLAGAIASLLSGARGGWPALVLAVIPAWVFGRHWAGRRIVMVTASIAGLAAAAYLIPATGVAGRLQFLVADLQKYKAGITDSSSGARFEMWRGAWQMLVEHPLAGVGRANFNRGLAALIERGDINPSVRYFYHAHNEFLHQLATQGIPGGIALALLYGGPLLFFQRLLRSTSGAQPYAVAGMLLVLTFAICGMTQALFSHHVGASFYALTVCVLAGLCLSRERAAQQLS